MAAENLVPLIKFCESHGIEEAFILRLGEFGLIEITDENDNFYLQAEIIPRVEKIMRFHFELDINLEGIDAILHLLEQNERLQAEIVSLKNQLRRFHIPGDAL